MSVLNLDSDDHKEVFNLLMSAFNSTSSSTNMMAELAMKTSVDISTVVAAQGCVAEIYDNLNLHTRARRQAAEGLQSCVNVIELIGKIIQTDDPAIERKFKEHLVSTLSPYKVMSLLTSSDKHIELMRQRMPEVPMPGARFKGGELVRQDTSGQGEEA